MEQCNIVIKTNPYTQTLKKKKELKKSKHYGNFKNLICKDYMVDELVLVTWGPL